MVVLIFFGSISWLFTLYNVLIHVKGIIKKRWAKIDALLMHRLNENPRLVKGLKTFVKQDRNMFNNTLGLRASYLDAIRLNEKVNADNQKPKSLKFVFAIFEAYSKMSSNDKFLNLEGRISGLLNKISDRRRLYNDFVNNYNIRIQSILDNYVAKTMGLE